MTSQPLYMKLHPVCRATYTLYMRHHSHYLCPHTHCIENSTQSLYDITLAICVASFALYKTSHPQFMNSDHRIYVITPTIFDIMSTLSVSSHSLYWCYHSNCISEITSAIIHGIISIVHDMTATVWHHNHCIHYIRFPTYEITAMVYDFSSHIPVTSQTLCLWIDVSYI